MPTNPSSSVRLDVNVGDPEKQPEPAAVEAAPQDPFRILLLGDFSGRESRPALNLRRPQRIDRDNFDDVLASMHVQATLPLGAAGTVNLNFTALSDFEPDSIFKRCDYFTAPLPSSLPETSGPEAIAARVRKRKACRHPRARRWRRMPPSSPREACRTGRSWSRRRSSSPRI